MAQRVKALGTGLLLDLHYSDTWADPGQQAKPAAWASLSFDELTMAVQDYTRDVITSLKNQGTLPDIVQIGNEITQGFLWDDGRVGGGFEGNWPRFAALLNAATAGVGDGLDAGQSVRIMLHIDRGGDNAACRWFFDNVVSHGVDFDIIGLSFYPWWHGTLDALERNLDDLAPRYGKELLVVETAYPWTLGWLDDTPNLVGLPSQLHAGFPASVGGQRRFLCHLTNIVHHVPQEKGVGLVYWAPDWISAPGSGSAWENLALFDFAGHRLDSMSAFGKRFSGFDLRRFADFQRCFRGPGSPPADPECLGFDFDCDDDVDVEDFAGIAGGLTDP
jgi:arabinogalactan endo-1,4-beta-galactosidase